MNRLLTTSLTRRRHIWKNTEIDGFDVCTVVYVGRFGFFGGVGVAWICFVAQPAACWSDVSCECEGYAYIYIYDRYYLVLCILVGASTMYWGITQCKNDNMTVQV